MLDRSFSAAAIALLATVGTAPLAFAQGGAAPDAAARRELLEQAQHAREANDHARALEMATRAGRIEMTPSVRLFIAIEQQTLGQLAEAIGNAELCVRETQRDATARNRETILGTCRELLDRLRPRVGRVTVGVASPAPAGLSVTVAGRPLNDAFYGVPYIVTPGSIAVDASAPGRVPFHREVPVTPGATVAVSIELPPGADPPVTTSVSAATPSTEHSAGGAGSTPPLLEGPRDGGRRGGTPIPVAPVVVASIGGLGLIAAGVFFALREGELGSCPNDTCSSQAAADAAQPRVDTYTTLINVGLIGGGVAAAGGLVWFLLSNSARRPSTPARAALTLVPSPHGLELVVGGTL